MWKCSHCAKEVDPELNVCWNCGYSEDGKPPSKEVHALLKDAKKEQKADRESERLSRSQLYPAAKNEAIIVDIRIPFISMVVLMVKWTLAAIPAMLILGFFGFLLIGGFKYEVQHGLTRRKTPRRVS